MLNEFISTTNTDTIIKILGILVTAITTYFVTKYSTNRPRKLEIKQRQLTNVYLPIHKLIKSHNINDIYEIDKITILECATKIEKILLEHYELAYPQLHKLNNLLIYSCNNNDDYHVIFSKISYQVNLDYVLLKKSLGYPSESSLGIFKRMNKKDKAKELIGWTFVIYLSLPIPLLIIIDKYKYYFDVYNFIFSYIFVFLLFIVLSGIVNSMKD